MKLYSMTGFGKSVAELGNQSIAIQIKSLNSKTLDIFTKLPPFLRDREVEIRSMLSQKLERGKIEISITAEDFGGCGTHTINTKVADQYLMNIKDMMFQLSLEPPEDFVSLLLKMPNVIQGSRENVSDDEWKTIYKAVEQAIHDLNEWRNEEGKTLAVDIGSRIEKIRITLDKVIPLEQQRKPKLYEKLKHDFSSLAQDVTIDQNRLEQELMYYLDRIDITEEIVRARKHCEYFIQVLNSEESTGKKLTFISQEILRELNTMGVKANDFDIQILTVEMKDEIEKIREQLGNIL